MAQTGCVPNPLWMTQSLTAPLLSMTPRQQENVGYSVQLPKAGAAPSPGARTSLVMATSTKAWHGPQRGISDGH